MVASHRRGLELSVVSFGRLLTAMVTPMNEKLEVDFQAAANLAQHLVVHGSDGIVVASTTGESSV